MGWEGSSPFLQRRDVPKSLFNGVINLENIGNATLYSLMGQEKADIQAYFLRELDKHY